MRRIPILSTLIVLAAVAVMVALGFWQLRRLAEKEAEIARFQRLATVSAAVPFPADPAAYPDALYRHASVTCTKVLAHRTTAATSFEGASGVAHVVTCETVEAGQVEIALGFSPDPRPYAWKGGWIEGVVANAGTGKVRLVAGKPAEGLAPLRQPDPSDLPNNHLSYAIQWFLFAATALVIYALALRRRWRQARPA